MKSFQAWATNFENAADCFVEDVKDKVEPIKSEQ